MTFGGTVTKEARGASAVVEAFRRLGPIIERNDIRQVIVEGDRAFVLHDFVTDTEAGAVVCGEYVTTEEG